MEVLIRLVSKDMQAIEEVLELLKRHFPTSYETGRNFCTHGPYAGFFRAYLTVVLEEKTNE